MVDKDRADRIASLLAETVDRDAPVSADALEARLLQLMADLDPEARIATLETVLTRLGASEESPPPNGNDEPAVLMQICSLILGRTVSADDLSSNELIEKLAESLNTIFNTLNQLISVINTTFTGEGSPEQTIRQVISFRLEGEGQGSSLETYLAQISDAFLISQRAFKEAAHAKLQQVLGALDPASMAEASGGGLKFGALKKADMFDIYAERYAKIQKWFDSGRFTEDFLRDFEKQCQTLFARQGG